MHNALVMLVLCESHLILHHTSLRKLYCHATIASGIIVGSSLSFSDIAEHLVLLTPNKVLRIFLARAIIVYVECKEMILGLLLLRINFDLIKSSSFRKLTIPGARAIKVLQALTLG